MAVIWALFRIARSEHDYPRTSQLPGIIFVGDCFAHDCLISHLGVGPNAAPDEFSLAAASNSRILFG